MEIKILEDLGLTESEIKVYLALLELGNASAGELLVKSDVQNSVMHRAVNSLINKGLVNFILEGKRRIYQATEPEQLFNFIEEKKRKLMEILPKLKKRQYFAKSPRKASVYKGLRGVKEVYSILLKEDAKEYLSFGGGEDCQTRMGTAWWNNHHLKRIKKGMKSRQVFDTTVKKFGYKLNERKYSRVRFIPSEFHQLQETVIVGELVAITIFTENAYSILIRDQRVANGYKKHFELLWKSGKKIVKSK